jgi:hypothetical protein
MNSQGGPRAPAHDEEHDVPEEASLLIDPVGGWFRIQLDSAACDVLIPALT